MRSRSPSFVGLYLRELSHLKAPQVDPGSGGRQCGWSQIRWPASGPPGWGWNWCSLPSSGPTCGHQPSSRGCGSSRGGAGDSAGRLCSPVCLRRVCSRNVNNSPRPIRERALCGMSLSLSDAVGLYIAGPSRGPHVFSLLQPHQLLRTNQGASQQPDCDSQKVTGGSRTELENRTSLSFPGSETLWRDVPFTNAGETAALNCVGTGYPGLSLGHEDGEMWL